MKYRYIVYWKGVIDDDGNEVEQMSKTPTDFWDIIVSDTPKSNMNPKFDGTYKFTWDDAYDDNPLNPIYYANKEDLKYARRLTESEYFLVKI